MKIFSRRQEASFARPAALSLLLALLFLGTRPGRAAPPTLEPINGSELQSTYRTGEAYTLRLLFKDPDGDLPRSAKFFDESPAGNVAFGGKIGSGDPRTGIVIEWPIQGLAQGGHNNTRFEVKGSDGQTARYPLDPNGFYSFSVESLVTKLITLGAGLLVGLLFVPFLFYILFRAMNRRGDPSRAARVGLLLGILACTALFIYLFASFYGPLVYVLGAVVALALLAVVLTRR